jgi:GNAT superfamily N-acetyltransferase
LKLPLVNNQNYIVRQAAVDDLKQYNTLLSKFHANAPISTVIKFDPEGCYSFLLNSLDNSDVCLFVCENESKEIIGVTAAVAYPMYFNPNAFVAQELWWWIEPEHRGSGAGKLLYNSLESWAKDKNLNSLFMIALEDRNIDTMLKIYKQKGYTPLERIFIKEFQ